jgi:hypothetical protein
MTHYHAIIDSLAHPGAYAPVLETDTRNDEILWEMWIDGFAQAMALSQAAGRASTPMTMPVATRRSRGSDPAGFRKG